MEKGMGAAETYLRGAWMRPLLGLWRGAGGRRREEPWLCHREQEHKLAAPMDMVFDERKMQAARGG
jgi:hypothetical protein